MMMLDKLFNWGKKSEAPEIIAPPPIIFGRYSDNNKTVYKTNCWTDADHLFNEKKYHESINAFFEYLRDDEVQNVTTSKTENGYTFVFYQGSKVVRGNYNKQLLSAEVALAKMTEPSVPVMRRLLEQNFNLYYSRFALNNNCLCMKFDTPVEVANPNKLYYAFKEMATKADKQDDMLIQDFLTLQPVDTEHIEEIPVAEKEIKYNYLMKWIRDSIKEVEQMDAEKMSGGITHLLLNLAYRIDYLIVPEGKLLYDLEDLVTSYFIKDEKQVQEKNNSMLNAFKKILEKTKEDVYPCLFRSKHSFAVTVPQTQKVIADTIFGANQNTNWFKENNFLNIAQQVSEYGLAFCQYNFSLPKVITDLYHILMKVCYSDYFKELGIKEELYNSNTKKFNKEVIEQNINKTISNWKEKYQQITFKTENLKYDSLSSFTQSLTAEIEFVNTETR
jgi:hypothetical protein